MLCGCIRAVGCYAGQTICMEDPTALVIGRGEQRICTSSPTGRAHAGRSARATRAEATAVTVVTMMCYAATNTCRAVMALDCTALHRTAGDRGRMHCISSTRAKARSRETPSKRQEHGKREAFADLTPAAVICYREAASVGLMTSGYEIMGGIEIRTSLLSGQASERAARACRHLCRPSVIKPYVVPFRLSAAASSAARGHGDGAGAG